MWTLPGLAKLRWIVPLALRAVLGAGFLLVHGLAKVRPEGTWDWGQSFAAKHPDLAPAALLYFAAWTEFLGGLLLVLGLLTRWTSLALIGVLGYAIFVVHAGDPFHERELAAVYLGGLVALLATGPGPCSLDRMIFGKQGIPD